MLLQTSFHFPVDISDLSFGNFVLGPGMALPDAISTCTGRPRLSVCLAVLILRIFCLGIRRQSRASGHSQTESMHMAYVEGQ